MLTALNIQNFHDTSRVRTRFFNGFKGFTVKVFPEPFVNKCCLMSPVIIAPFPHSDHADLKPDRVALQECLHKIIIDKMGICFTNAIDLFELARR